MQKITIEVKDNYMNNVLEMLHGLQGVMIDKIKLADDDNKVENDFMKLQISSMEKPGTMKKIRFGMICKQGDIVLIKFPFTTLSKSKNDRFLDNALKNPDNFMRRFIS